MVAWTNGGEMKRRDSHVNGHAGNPGPPQEASGQVNGSRWTEFSDRHQYLNGGTSYDPGPANGSDSRAGQHRGGGAGRPAHDRPWPYGIQLNGESQAPRGRRTRHDIPGPDPWARKVTPEFPVQPYRPVAGGNGRAVDRREPWHVLEHAPGRAVDRLNPALVPEPPTAVLAYPQPGEGGRLLLSGRHPVLVAAGSGPRLGVRAAVVALTALVILAAIGYGVYATMQTAPLTDLSAEVVSTGQVALGFPQSGVLAKVFVRPGEHLAVGQVVATEMVAGLNQQVTADEKAVRTDQDDIDVLQALLTEANKDATADIASQQQVAAAGVSSATGAIDSTQSARQAAISAFQAEVNAATQTLQTDEATYASTCGSSPAGSAGCQSLSHTVAEDKQSLSAAQANLSAQQAAQAEWEAEANRLLADEQAAQEGLNQNTTLALAPLDVDLASARSQLVKDQAQLATDQARQAEERLQAPLAGTVVSVDGQPGEVVSGTGVSGGNATGGSVTVKPGFDLFPSQQSSVGSQASSPVAVLDVGGALLVNVVVPESQIGLVRLGAPVSIVPDVSGPRPASGVVTEIFPSSIVAAGVVSYEVQVKANSHANWNGWLPGITATATISR